LAWSDFRRAAAVAHSKDDARREEYALAQVARLEPRLPRLTLSAAPELAGVTIKRDGLVLDPQLLGSELPVDPGEHEVVVEAPGKVPFRKQLRLNEGERLKLSIPPLQHTAVEPAAVPAARQVADQPARLQRRPQPRNGAWLAASIGTGTGGVVALGMSAMYGLRARSRWQTAEAGCQQLHSQCTHAANQLGRQADAAASVATAAFVVGAVSTALSVACFTLWRTSARTEVNVGPGSARLTWTQTF
jgi:hypothetical protein